MERPSMETAMSNDVVMDIVLSHLKVIDLLNCRKVSKFWNKAASSALRRRWTKIRNIEDDGDLMKLEECLKQSSDFPFAGLQFYRPRAFSSASVTKFLKSYGDKFTSLYLVTRYDPRIEELAPFINHLPRLAILETGTGYSSNPRRGPYAELLDSAAGGQEDGSILNLPSLHTLKIYDDFSTEALRQVCETASPLLRIECAFTDYRIVEALKRLGKLQAISAIEMPKKDEIEHALRVTKLLSTESPPLTKLDIDFESCFSREGLVKLLISSQDTLKELRLVGIHPSQFLFECPVLAKLSTFSLVTVKQSSEHVFKGREGHKFPALQQLKLYFSSTRYLSDDLFIVPSLTRIDLDGYVDKTGIEELARSFPNVTEIQLESCYLTRWKDNLLNIWNVGAFKFLEKLRIRHFIVGAPTLVQMNMDSFLTGIPVKMCEDLRKQNQQFPFNETLRGSPNILQLKNLKELIIFLRPAVPLRELPEEAPFISMVSVWYALQMIPNLQTKFMYDDDSLHWCRRSHKVDRRDKAVKVLEAAFKHVQPYVKLEPFYY